MLLFQLHPDLQHQSQSTSQDFDWCAVSAEYANIEAATFITRNKESAPSHLFTTTADPAKLQDKQLKAYNLIKEHNSRNDSDL